MRSSGSQALSLGFVALAVALLAGCAASGGTVPEITSIEYSQLQAIPDFDNSIRVTTQADDIAALTKVLETYGVTGNYASTGEACPGGRVTEVDYTTVAKVTVHLAIHGSCDFTDFEKSVDGLVTSWRMRG